MGSQLHDTCISTMEVLPSCCQVSDATPAPALVAAAARPLASWVAAACVLLVGCDCVGCVVCCWCVVGG